MTDDDRYIEFTALIGPIGEPHLLHTPDGKGGLGDTEHGRTAHRLFDVVADIVEADMSASITTDADSRSALIAERNRYRAALQTIAIPPVHIPDLSEGCEGCAGVARAALDGTDYRGHISVTPAQAVTGILGPTSPEYQALVQQAMDLADERDRLIGHLNEYARSCLTHVAERDRLRTVVEAVVAALASEEMEPDEWSEVAGVVADLVAERDRLRTGLDTILGGLVGLDSDDAYVAITMEHMNVVRAMLRKDGT